MTSPVAAEKEAAEPDPKPEKRATPAQREVTEPEPMETSTLKPASWASMSKKAKTHWLQRNSPKGEGGDVPV